MRKFLLQLLLFSTLLILLDRSFIVFRINETNIFSDIAKEKMKKLSSKISTPKILDVLIVGSSHAQFGISPEVLEKKMGGSVLNVAYGGGANMGVQLTLLHKLIEDKKVMPKVIVFGLDVFALNAEPTHTDQFQPYLFNEEEDVSEFFNSKMFYSYFKLYSRFIPRYIAQARSGNYVLPYFDKKNTYDLTMFSKFDKYEISDGGWVRGYGYLNKNYIRYSETLFSPAKKAIADINEYVELCKKNKIDLVFVQVPEHTVCMKWKKKYDDFELWMNDFVTKNNLTYWNMNTVSNFPTGNDSLFFDTDHLNKDGAELLSERLVEMLKTLPKKFY